MPEMSGLSPVEGERPLQSSSVTPPSSGSETSREIRHVTEVKPIRRMSTEVGDLYRSNSDRSSRDSSSGRSSIHSLIPDFEVTFVQPLEKKFECPVCGQYLKNPVKFQECGHHCCNTCMQQILRVAAKCPVDQTQFNPDSVLLDIELHKQIEALLVKCSRTGRGCVWQGRIPELIPHLHDCQYVTVLCPNDCGIEFEKRSVTKHAEEECPRREIVCGHCEEVILAGDEDDHMSVCPKVPIKCPNSCKPSTMLREDVAAHLKEDCPLQTIFCPFYPFGCKLELQRTKIAHHLDDSPKVHLDLVCGAMTKHESLIKENQEKIVEQRQEILAVGEKVETLLKVYGVQFLWKIDNFEDRYHDAKSGRKCTIFSPQFYTHRHGYKMAVSACLNGDGRAKGKFMSVFICLCRGEYDALLPWPFAHKVNVTLMDQCPDVASRRNITYVIKPNTCKENRPFIGRPSSERNASFGAQKFVELKTIKKFDYIRESTMYIRINVDLTTIPEL